MFETCRRHQELTFIWPCIVIYFYSKTNEMHQFLKFISFCSSTLRVWDGLSVRRQESETVRTASGTCQTDSADCLLAGTRWNEFHLVPASKQSAESVWHMPDAVCTVLDSWRRTERPPETCFHLIPASKQSAESIWHIPDAVRTVLDSWRWTERLSQTCSISFPLTSSRQNPSDIYLMLYVQS